LLGENVALSKSLTTRVDQLVGGAKHEFAGANIEAASVVRWSTWIVIIAVVLSLASSILIVWLYVGRNLITRLTALSDRMLTLAGGDLNPPFRLGEREEMGRRAGGLGLFRATAIEMEEAN